MVKKTAYKPKKYGSKTRKVKPETKNIFDITEKQRIARVIPKMKPAKPGQKAKRIGELQRRRTSTTNYKKNITIKKVERGNKKVAFNIAQEKKKNKNKKLPF